MTIYKPMTPEMRRKISNIYDAELRKFDGCQDTPYVKFVRELYRTQRDFITSLPDGYLIPFNDNK